MKAEWTIWNKLVLALSCIMLLWAVAPRHDCFCGEMQAKEPATAHDCCKHACCNESDGSRQTCQEKSGSLLQDRSCCCAAERVQYAEQRKGDMVPETDSTQVKQQVLLDKLIGGSLARTGLSELQNDILKPSRIFLLKCAWLN